MTARRFCVEVHFTNRTRTPEGGFRTFWSRVDVLADSPLEAEWIGTCMVIGHPARESLDCMPVASRLVV